MKKVILCVFALLTVSLGYSQVNDLLDKGLADDSDASSVPNLSPNPLANKGLSVQTGNSQKVLVQQAGTANAAWTVQENGSGIGENQARVRQTGNVGPFSGVANSAEVRQSGSLNQSTTAQEGDYNNALTRQGQNDGGASTSNKARIQQGVAQQGEYNFSNVTQDGLGNEAFTRQTYDNNDAWVTQAGDHNLSFVNQNGSPNGTDGHSGLVDQDGDFNESIIMQGGAGGRNDAKTLQLGNANHAKQVQTTDALTGSQGNNAIISQGDGGTPTFLNTSVLFGRIVPLDAGFQNGGFSGNSYNGVAFQFQAGHENEAEIHQFGADAPQGHNYGEQNQNGARNDAYIIQNAFGNPNGGANYARQDQMSGGDDNIAGIGQNGQGHKAYQRQFGDRNNAISTQRGTYNLVNTYQDGVDNWGTTKQVGQFNKALLVQKGTNSYMIDQNGVGNQAYSLQLGPDGNIWDDGENCYFEPQMDPMYIAPINSFDLDDICQGC